MIASGGYQIAQGLAIGADLQPLPLISSALGLIGLIVLLLSSDTLFPGRRSERRRRSSAGPSDQRQRGSCSQER